MRFEACFKIHFGPVDGVDHTHTDKKEKEIFLKYKKIQMGSVAKSYKRKDFLIYEEILKYLIIYEEAVSHIWLFDFATDPFWTSVFMRKIFFTFLSVHDPGKKCNKGLFIPGQLLTR